MELRIEDKKTIVKQASKQIINESKPAIRLNEIKEQHEQIEFNKMRLVYESMF